MTARHNENPPCAHPGLETELQVFCSPDVKAGVVGAQPLKELEGENISEGVIVVVVVVVFILTQIIMTINKSHHHHLTSLSIENSPPAIVGL